jgi:hypothetical protein
MKSITNSVAWHSLAREGSCIHETWHEKAWDWFIHLSFWKSTENLLDLEVAVLRMMIFFEVRIEGNSSVCKLRGQFACGVSRKRSITKNDVQIMKRLLINLRAVCTKKWTAKFPLSISREAPAPRLLEVVCDCLWRDNSLWSDFP